MTDFTFLTYLGSCVLAVLVGFITGIFGVGGGFLMVPALMILFGIAGNIAVGTSLTAIFVNCSFGMFKRRGSGTIDVKLALTIAAGSTVGILIGLVIMEALKTAPPLEILGKKHVAVQYVLLCLFLLLLVWIAGFMVFDAYRNSGRNLERRTGLFSKIKIPPYVHFSTLDAPRLSLVPVVMLGCAVGILTGLLGVGGGVIILPALVYLIGQQTVKAAGTSLLLVWISSAVGIIGHVIMGNVQPLLLVWMVVGGIVGINLGTYVGLKLTGSRIRCYFIYVVILAITMVACNLCKTTFG